MRRRGGQLLRLGRPIRPALALVILSLAGSAAAQDRDFTPVTDALLADPDPADWINWRRTLDGWGYSPLDQIDRDNVHQLGLVWSWTMPTGLAQPTPIVYDGVMYLPSPLNVVQALDAVTGDPIWEYRKRFERSPDDSFRARTRSIAIYDDKIYLNTNDAHIVALDALTGEVVWDHVVADNRLGYRYTSGPIVDQREDRRRHDRLRALQGRHLLHLGPRPADRRGAVAHVDRRPAGRSGRRHVGRPAGDVPGRRRRLDSGQLRPGHEPHLLVDLAGQAVGAAVARHRRRRALHEQRARPRPGHRPARLVLPVRAGRDARPRRRVRKRAHRPPRPAVAVQDGQAGHPVGARPGRPARSSPPTTSATRPWSTSTPTPARPPTGPR